jgi:hypothetical protein
MMSDNDDKRLIEDEDVGVSEDASSLVNELVRW